MQCFLDKCMGFFGGKQSKFEWSKNTIRRKAVSVYPYLKGTTRRWKSREWNETARYPPQNWAEWEKREEVVYPDPGSLMLYVFLTHRSLLLRAHYTQPFFHRTLRLLLYCSVLHGGGGEKEKIPWWLGWMDHRMLYTLSHGFALRYFDEARHALTNNVHGFVLYCFLSI